MTDELCSLHSALRSFAEAAATQSQEHIKPLHWHIAVSVKGSLNAFRNLTNRMEEAAGDCTNIHLVYPAMVYGFFHILKANREQDVESRNDIAIHASGAIAPGIKRYHDAMARLSDRGDVREDVSRYESVALILAGTRQSGLGELLPVFPPANSPLAFDRFFPRLYEIYDLRFVYSAPALESRTRRLEWTADSPALDLAKAAGFQPRVAEAE